MSEGGTSRGHLGSGDSQSALAAAAAAGGQHQHEVCVSAPGKLILFGEHAVVHGVTAVAAALSDLRIFVEMRDLSRRKLVINLHDMIFADGSCFSHAVEPDLLRDKLAPIPEAFDLKGTPPSSMSLEGLRHALRDLPDTAQEALTAACFLATRMLPELFTDQAEGLPFAGLQIDVRSHMLPVGAGLGSSAAFSVALVAAFTQLRQELFGDLDGWTTESGDSEALEYDATPFPPNMLDAVNSWAFAAESVIHGKPSGVDNTVSCFGGAISFRKDVDELQQDDDIPPSVEINRVDHGVKFRALLVNTKIARKTSVLVEKVGQLLSQVPDIARPIFSSIEGISAEFLALCRAAPAESSSDGNASTSTWYEQVKRLMTINQHLLDALGVGHPALDEVVAIAGHHGLGAKLTGAGGGGCAFVLLDPEQSARDATSQSHVDHVELLQVDLLAHGYSVVESNIGGSGLLCHDHLPAAVTDDETPSHSVPHFALDPAAITSHTTAAEALQDASKEPELPGAGKKGKAKSKSHGPPMITDKKSSRHGSSNAKSQPDRWSQVLTAGLVGVAAAGTVVALVSYFGLPGYFAPPPAESRRRR